MSGSRPFSRHVPSPYGLRWKRALITSCGFWGGGGMWLHLLSILFVFARIAHGIGMDAEKAGLPRQIGVVVTMLTLLGLSVFAALIGFGVV